VYRLFLALRYLRSRLVNLISIGGVMAGVAVLIVVVAIMDGFQDRVRTSVRGSLSHIIMTPKTSAEDLISFGKLEDDLREEPHVEAAAPLVNLPVFFEYPTMKVSAVSHEGMAWHQMEALGVDWQREQAVTDLASYLLVAHDPKRPFFHPVAAAREKATVLVSKTFATRFFLGPIDPETGLAKYPYGALRDEDGPLKDLRAVLAGCRALIGTELRIMWGNASSDGGERQISTNSKNLVISGVYDGLDTVEDSRRLYMRIDEVRRMGRIEHDYLQARVKLDDYEHARAVRARLTSRFERTFVVETWEDQKADFLRAVNSEKVLLVIVLSFIVLLGGFVILATLTLTVVEKTRDIGIVAALGATKRGILTVFLWNGLLIGVLGAILGLGLGAWFTANVDGVHAAIKKVTGRDVFPPEIYHFDSVPTVWHWDSVFVIMGGAVLVAFLAGLLPALRAARLDPIAALRHE
jgi:lipoprotein-releasing system permease protein